MRAIVLGSELISLATTSHLADIGYEVILIQTQAEIDLKKQFLKIAAEQQYRELEEKLAQKGIQFKNVNKIEKFIVQGKRIRGISIFSGSNQNEILIAERFVAAFDCRDQALLASLGIRSAAHFKPLYSGFTHHPLIGKSHYTNLFLNLSSKLISPSVALQMGEVLADYIYNPASNQDTGHPLSARSASIGILAYLSSIFSFFQRSFAMYKFI